MKVYAVQVIYPYLYAIFSSKKLAEEYASTLDSRLDIEITDWIVDEP